MTPMISRPIITEMNDDPNLPPCVEDLSIIATLNRATTRGDSLEELIGLLVHEVESRFSGFDCTVYLLSDDGEFLAIARKSVAPPRWRKTIERIIGTKIPTDVRIHLEEGGLYHRLLRDGIPQLTNDPKAIEALISECTESAAVKKLAPVIRGALGIQSVISVPLVAAGEVVGLLDMSSKERFSETDLERFAIIASPVTIMLKHQILNNALRESEGKYRSLTEAAFDTARVSIFVLDADFRVVWMNGAAERVFGIPKESVIGCDRREVIGRKGAEIFADPEEFASRLLATYEDNTYVESFECHVLPGPGRTERFLEHWSQPIQSGLYAGGRLEHYTDITERKRSQEELGQLHQQHELILQSVGEGVFGLNLRGEVTFVNQAAAVILGYTIDELIGTDHHEMVHYLREDGSPHPPDQCALLSVLKGARVQHQARDVFVGKDGDLIPVEYLSRQLRRGDEPVGAVVTFRDITERRRAERALLEERDLLRTVIDNIPDYIYIKDLDGHCITSNASHAEMLGANSRAEVEGKTDFDVHPRDLAEQYYAVDREVIGSGQPVVDREEEVVDHAGHKLRLLTTKVPFRDMTGAIAGIVGIGRNVTEQRNLEERFRQAQKLEAIGRLAGGIAHDFNNLMTVVTGYSELLLPTFAKDESAYKNILEIKKAAERATSLTSQLLAFSRKQILQPEILDLNAVLRNVQKMLNHLIGEDLDLDVVYGKELGLIEADAGQMDQVIMNLVVNARDAMPTGGKLTIETVNAELDEGDVRRHVGLTPGPYVVLAVSDTGIGMDSETRSQIFEPFFTTKEAGEGTGLGLSTVYGIVKQSGGNILVYSEPGEGTTFKIYLPCVRTGAAAVSQEKLPDEEFGGTETILLVEDEEMVRNLAKLVLVTNGYTVLEARNGEEALQVFEKHEETVHLVLTDVVMPRMGGHDLKERLSAVAPDTKMVFMSGYTDNAIQHHGVLSSGVTFLQKPFNATSLLRIVRDTVGKD